MIPPPKVAKAGRPEKRRSPPRHSPTAAEQRDLLEALARPFAVVADPSLAPLVHYCPARTKPFHHWFRYREGYAPELLDRVLPERDRLPGPILDPFCGCGSTLLAARGRNLASVGFDVNPLAVLVARAKTRNYTARHLRRLRVQVQRLGQLHPGLPAAPPPALRIIDQVFKADILHALLTARHLIEQEQEPAVRGFLQVGWLAILEGVSNVFKEGNGIKYRNRKRTPQGYRAIPWEQTAAFQHEGFALVKARLQAQYAAMLADLQEAGRRPEPDVYPHTALEMERHLERDSVALCLFSPPYCNNFNYMKIFKVELWLGGFVRTYAELRALTRQALRSHVETVLDTDGAASLPPALSAIVTWIRGGGLWNEKIPDAVVAYFLDMRTVLEQVQTRLRPGGRCHLVVGNSAYGGVVVPTDLLLAEIAAQLGFRVERLLVARHLTTSSQQRGRLAGLLGMLRETLIVLRKQ